MDNRTFGNTPGGTIDLIILDVVFGRPCPGNAGIWRGITCRACPAGPPSAAVTAPGDLAVTVRETAAAVGAAVFGDVASEDTARRLIKKLAAAGLAGPPGTWPPRTTSAAILTTGRAGKPGARIPGAPRPGRPALQHVQDVRGTSPCRRGSVQTHAPCG